MQCQVSMSGSAHTAGRNQCFLLTAYSTASIGPRLTEVPMQAQDHDRRGDRTLSNCIAWNLIPKLPNSQFPQLPCPYLCSISASSRSRAATRSSGGSCRVSDLDGCLTVPVPAPVAGVFPVDDVLAPNAGAPSPRTGVEAGVAGRNGVVGGVLVGLRRVGPGWKARTADTLGGIVPEYPSTSSWDTATELTAC